MNLTNTINYTTNRLIMENLIKHGSITIEEATFLNKLAADIITEAAGEFGQQTEGAPIEGAPIEGQPVAPVDGQPVAPVDGQPDASVDGQPDDQPAPDTVLTDEQGNQFIYDPVTGELSPVDTPAATAEADEPIIQADDTSLDDAPDEPNFDDQNQLTESELFAHKLLKY